MLNPARTSAPEPAHEPAHKQTHKQSIRWGSPVACLGLALGLLYGAPVQSQLPDPTQLLQGLIKQTVPGLAPGSAPAPVQADELLRLLSQSGEEISEAREIEIGRQLAAVLLGSKPLWGDMAAQRYVNQLGRWISLQSSRPTLPWSFAVLDDPGYNAFAAPGGYVFITRGLFEAVADEAELAGILAHEITHVTSRHHLEALRKNARSGLLQQLAVSQLRDNTGGLLSSALLTLGRNLYSRGLDQSDEYDADRQGLALAARAGFDPYGLLAALQHLRTAPAQDALYTLTLATHPPAQTRMERLEKDVRGLDRLSGQASVKPSQRVAALMARPASSTAAGTAAPGAPVRGTPPATTPSTAVRKPAPPRSPGTAAPAK